MTITEKKYKSGVRLLNRLKFKRHKRIRSGIRANQKKIDFFSGIGRDRSKRQYFLKKERLQSFYETVPFHRGDAGSKEDPDVTQKTPEENFYIKKKKYKIGSYLFGVICKFPRKYLYHSLGKDIVRKWYTMPFRLSMARFVGNRFLKTYYSKNLSHRALSNLALALNNNKQHFNAPRYENEKAKGLLTAIEQRLDSTLLRLLHFKPTHTLKRADRRKVHATKYPRYKTKLPLLSYSPAHIRQQISHKHIFVSGIGTDLVAKRTVQKGAKLQTGDQIQFKGFTTRLLSNAKCQTQDLKYTMLLRRFKNQSFVKEKEHMGDVLDYIQGLRLKRFTEAFYMTYRDLHFVEKTHDDQSVEKHIQPIFHAIGFNQSLFVGWPLVSLLWVSPWTARVRSNIMQTATKSAETEKRRLKSLLRWKRFQLSTDTATTVANTANRMRIPDAALQTQAKFPLSKCYASMVYGTRTCKWVKLQQGSDVNAFHNKIYKKTNFLELELDFFLLIHRCYV